MIGAQIFKAISAASLALGFTFAAALCPQPGKDGDAIARTVPALSSPVGQTCSVAQRESGSYWRGSYRGLGDGSFVGRERIDEIEQVRCFHTGRDCRAWLRDVRAATGSGSVTECRQHYG